MREQPIRNTVPLRWYSDLLEDADFSRGLEHEISKERAVPALVRRWACCLNHRILSSKWTRSLPKKPKQT
ncbi:hypothetical protein EHI44_33380 [Rhizobium leguminosarum]|nr:hypothetical protein EHI44_33380 [Rhizobium leguminosarum]